MKSNSYSHTYINWEVFHYVELLNWQELIPGSDTQTKTSNMYMASLSEGSESIHQGKLHKAISNHARCERPWLAEDPANTNTLIELHGT